MSHLEDPEFHMQALAAQPKISVLPYSDPDVRYRVWKTKSIELSEALTSEMKSYVVFLESALDVCDRTGQGKQGLQKGLYLMLMRARWAFDAEISGYTQEAIELLGNHEVLSSSAVSKLTNQLRRVNPKRPRFGIEIMATFLNPLDHISAYATALSERIK
jgi:hypothetical protein